MIRISVLTSKVGTREERVAQIAKNESRRRKRKGWFGWLYKLSDKARGQIRLLKERLSPHHERLERQLRVRKRVILRRISRSDYLGTNGLKLLLLIVGFIGFAVWLNSVSLDAYTYASSLIGAIPWSAVGRLILVATLIALGILAFQKGWWNRKPKWAATAVVVVIGAFLIWTFWPRTRKSVGHDSPDLIVTRELSPKILIRPGQQVVWDRRENAAYEVVIQTGESFGFPRDPDNDTRSACEKHAWIDKKTTSFQIRVTDPEIDEVGFDFTFSPYQKGGPCSGISYVPPAPSPSVPVLPDKPRNVA